MQERLAKSLGWFSIGLGIAELAATDAFSQFIGIGPSAKSRRTMKVFGLREIVAGFGILSNPRQSGWLWARFGGDLLDLASLGSAMGAWRSDRNRLNAATIAVLGVTALDAYSAVSLKGSEQSASPAPASRVRVVKAIAVDKSPAEAYAFWRDLKRAPEFMEHIRSVRVIDNRRSHWEADTHTGGVVEWDSEIVDDQPDKRIAWRATGHSDLYNSGSVTFEQAAGDRGTIVRVEFEFAPPGGAVGAAIGKLFKIVPDVQVGRDLHAFKQMLEIGEVMKSDASIHAGMHAAQPPAQKQARELVRA